MAHANDPMTALVEYQVRSETTTMDEWLDEWQKRAIDVHEGEPETGAYEAAINLDDGTKVLVFERYDHGARSLKLHMDRPAHESLITTMGTRRMTKRRVMSMRCDDVSDWGWWSRPERADLASSGGSISGGAISGGKDAVLALLGMRFPDADQRQSFIEISRSHTDYCWTGEPDTLVYGLGTVTEDGDRDLDLNAGDLVAAMVFSNAAAADQHRDDPNHVAMADRYAGIDIQRTFLNSYRTTGRGFLWRA